MNTIPNFTDWRGRPILPKKLSARALARRAQRRAILGACLILLAAFGTVAAVTQMDLTTQVKGILPVANGGTGSSTLAGAGVEVVSHKDAASGYAGLDSGSKILATELPNPSASTLGGTESKDCSGANGGINKINTDGTVTCIGAAVLSGTFGDNETPTGTIDGSNTVFTLANTPSPAASLTCHKNGQTLIAGGADFTLSVATITYTSGAKPLTGDVHRCSYRF